MKKLMLAVAAIAAVLGVGAATLPDGYAEVEYLRLTGKQYADMGMKLTQLHKVEIVYQCDQSGKQLVFGSRTDAKNNNFLHMLDGSCVLDFDNTKGASIKYRLTWARAYGEKLFVSASNMERICRRGSPSGEIIAHNTDAIPETLTTPGTCLLGSANASISGFQGLVGRIYSFRISDTRTGRVYRQLVPAVRQTDGVAGFYDVADHSKDSGYEPFYPSVGTAAFLPSEVPLSFVAKPMCTINGNGTLDVTFAPSAIPLVLYLAYGNTDAGDTTNGWDRVVNAGAVETKATEVRGIPLPDDWGTDALAVRAFLCSQSDALGAGDYVKDGLIVLYDARENNGFGVHSADITHWKDLSGNGYDMDLKMSGGHITVREDDIKFSSCRTKPSDGAWNAADRPQVADGDISVVGPKTLEVMARTDSTFNQTMVGDNVIDLVYLGSHGMISFSPTSGKYLIGRFVDKVGSKTRNFCDSSSPCDSLASICTLRSYSATYDPSNYATDTLRVDGNSYVSGSGTEDSNASGNSEKRLILGLNRSDAFFSSVRLYDRVLTDEERIWNARVDRVRYQGGDLVASEPCFAPVSFKIVSLTRQGAKVTGAKIVLPASDSMQEVLVAWARKDAGTDISGWGNVARVAEIQAYTTACDVTFPEEVVEQWTGNVGIRLFVRPVRTSKDYVLDGLVVMYDARENNGFGVHSADITHWKDLSGNGYDMDLKVGEGHVTVRDDDIKFSACRTKPSDGAWNAADRPQVADGNISVVGPKTLEVVARADDTFNSTMVNTTVDLAFLGSHGMISFSPTSGKYLFGRFVDKAGSKTRAFCDSTSPYDSLQSIRALRSYSATYDPSNYATDTLTVDGNSYVSGSGTEDSNASGNTEKRLILGLNRSDAFFSSVRLYNRVLTDEERIWNARVDRERYQTVPAATDYCKVSSLGLIIVVE